VLHYGLEGEPTKLIPSEAIDGPSTSVLFFIGEPLYKLNHKSELVPNLATSYKESGGGLTWTFQLRKGVKFSNGKPLTSADVAFSIETARQSLYFASFYERINEVQAPSPSTVIMKLKEPAPALLAELSLFSADIIPDNYGGLSKQEFATHPIATGPFAVKSWHPGSGVVLSKNKYYWKPNRPYLDEVVFTSTSEESARLAQIRGGDLDMTRANPIGAKTGVPQGSGARVEEAPLALADFLLLNQNSSVFDNASLRKAVNLAVDREGIIKAATAEKGQLGGSYITPTIPFYTPIQPPERNAAEAKSLVERATKEGANATFTIKTTVGDTAVGTSSQIVQQDLEEAGFTVKIQSLDEAALNEQIEAGEYDAVMAHYGPAIADPTELTTFYLTFYAKNSGADLAKQTAIAEEASSERNRQKRGQLYAQLQREIAAEESLLILDYSRLVYPVREDVAGVEFDGVGVFSMDGAGFSK
jgi:peptide/nickel transport system substrate-binding protein